MERPYHPEIARLAAQHDEIIRQMRAGMLTDSEARRRVVMLTARDDAGVEWSIDPDTGAWRFKNSVGVMSYAEPPRLGFDRTQPEREGSARRRDGWDRVRLHEVPEHLSPRTLPEDQDKPASGRFRAPMYVSMAAVAVSAFVLLLLR